MSKERIWVLVVDYEADFPTPMRSITYYYKDKMKAYAYGRKAMEEYRATGFNMFEREIEDT